VPVEYVDLAPAEYCIEVAREGESPWWLYAFSSMFDSVPEQRWAAVSEEVFRITGRAPTPLRSVLASRLA
jgi:NAD(P)H dehydrogenase (quinone)